MLVSLALYFSDTWSGRQFEKLIIIITNTPSFRGQGTILLQLLIFLSLFPTIERNLINNYAPQRMENRKVIIKQRYFKL